MSVARRWVFPIIWMVIFAVIGAALVKIAFFPDSTASGSDGLEPTGQVIEPQVPVITAQTARRACAELSNPSAPHSCRAGRLEWAHDQASKERRWLTLGG